MAYSKKIIQRRLGLMPIKNRVLKKSVSKEVNVWIFHIFGLVSLFNGIINLRGFFNVKAILVEKQ